MTTHYMNKSWWSIFMCCDCSYCCSCCTPKIIDYSKKYDIEIESLLPNQINGIKPNDKITINVINDQQKVEKVTKIKISEPSKSKSNDEITIDAINDKEKVGKVSKITFYHNWRPKYWLKLDKIIEYENYFKISPYYANDTKNKRKRRELYILMYKCFTKLPQSINEQIYCLLPSNSLIDNMYRIYFQSKHQNKETIDNPKDLGCLINASCILQQYNLYCLYRHQSSKNHLKQQQNVKLPKLPNFWKYIGLHSKSSYFDVTLIVKNSTKYEIFVTWISYNGKEEMYSNIYPGLSLTIGTHVTNTFAFRVSLFNKEEYNDNDQLIFNDLSIIGIYQIRHTYPTHIITVSSLRNKTKPIRISIGSPLRTVPVITKQYNKCKIQGFTVYYEQNAFEEYPKIRDILTEDLSKMNENIKQSILEIIRKVAIWINICLIYGHPDSMIKGYGLTFHHDPAWMIKNGIMIEKCYNIEIYSIKDYMEWRVCQPLVLFHEFVHSFHCHIGRDRRDIKKTYKMAMKNHLYDKVQHILKIDETTKQQIIVFKRGYAASNCYEYFAQISEAYFGQCNYYPFNKIQLKQYDYNAYQLCENIWSLSEKEINTQHNKYSTS